jgi:hypothetical protein
MNVFMFSEVKSKDDSSELGVPLGRMGKQYSIDSVQTLDKIHQLKDQYQSISRQVEQVEESTDMSDFESIAKAKNKLAQILGDVEKLQFNQLDAITTVNLESGKKEEKSNRRKLNGDLDTLQEIISSLYKQYSAVPPPPSPTSTESITSSNISEDSTSDEEGDEESEDDKKSSDSEDEEYEEETEEAQHDKLPQKTIDTRHDSTFLFPVWQMGVPTRIQWRPTADHDVSEEARAQHNLYQKRKMLALRRQREAEEMQRRQEIRYQQQFRAEKRRQQECRDHFFIPKRCRTLEEGTCGGGFFF